MASYPVVGTTKKDADKPTNESGRGDSFCSYIWNKKQIETNLKQSIDEII